MLSILLRFRVISFVAVLALLAGLLIWGRHVKYEQSLQSFFPSDDPAVIDYARASRAFGNDNVIFISYDDPQLLTPEGIARVRELAEACKPDKIPAVSAVQSLDAMPLFWQIDDQLINLMKAPAFARSPIIRVIKSSLGTLSQKDSPLTIAGAMKAADAAGRADLKAKITQHPLLQGTVINAAGTEHGGRRATGRDGRARPQGHGEGVRDAADKFAMRHGLGQPALVGPPVLLADGFEAIERDGQRLAIVGMGLIGLVTLTATHSLWWAIVPILAGWTVWLAAETVLSLCGIKLSLSGGPLVAQIIVLTMPAASHLAIHFRDDLRKELDRRAAARSTLLAVTKPILWCRPDRGNRLRGSAHE